MPLQEQVFSVSFAKGVNTKVDPKQIASIQGELLVLQNANFISPQEITEDFGSTPIPTAIYNTANNITNGNSVFTFNNQMVMSDGQMIYPFSETEEKWVSNPNLSTKVSNSISSSFIAGNANAGQQIGFAIAANGIEFYTYSNRNNNELTSVLYDPVLGTILYTSSTTVAGGGPPSQFYSFYVTGNGFFYTFFFSISTLYVFTISPTAPPTTPTVVPLITGLVSSAFDIDMDGDNFVIIYNNSTGTVLSQYTAALTLQNTVLLDARNSFPVNVYVDPTTGRVYVAFYIYLTACYIAIYSPTLTVVTSETAFFTSTSGLPRVNAMTGVVIGTRYFLYAQSFSIFSGASGDVVQSIQEYETSVPAVTPGVLGNFIFNASIYSKAYIFNGYPYLDLFFADPSGIIKSLALEQQLFISAQFTSSPPNSPLQVNYVAKYAEGTASGQPIDLTISTQFGIITRVIVNGNVSIHPYALIVSNTESSIINIARLKTTLGTQTQGVTLGDNLNLSGGIISIWDGLGVAENGFTVFPSLLGIFSNTPSSGGPWAAGTYSFVVTYDWTDNEGNLVRSAPSAPLSVTTTSTNTTLILSVAGLSLTEPYKLPNVIIKFWGTVSGGTIYYLLIQLNNSPQQMDVTVTPPLLFEPELYTTGGEVDNIAPPGTDLMTSFKNRLVVVQADSPYVWWYSKQNILGFPAEFSDFFTQNIDEFGGPISSITVMDDKLIFFKNSFIYYVIGDGPAPSGANNDFSYPQRVTTDVGCINQSSLIVIPIGIMFQSTDKGIFLLDRSMQVSYIGAAVEAFNGSLVTSAVLLPNTTQVRFTLNTSTILIYDYLVSQWSVHSGLTFVDSVIYKEIVSQLQSNGLILELTPATYQDNGNPVTMSLTTGWFSFAQKQGFQRVKQFQLLLTAVNATSLQIQMFYDFSPNITADTVLIPIPASSIPQKYRIFPSFQKCTSMQIVITEIPIGSVGGGLTISGLTFNMALKKGPSKLPATQTYG
jgi:hypothetical protein